MQKANSWLERLLHISEGTPYHSTLTVPKELRPQGQISKSGKKDLAEEGLMFASDDLEISGIVIFQLGNGILTFEFFIDDSILDIDELEAFSGSSKSETMESKVRLQISNLNFNYNVMITSSSDQRLYFDRNGNGFSPPSPVKGHIITRSFGKSDEPLDQVGIWFYGLPERWYGNGNYRYYQGIIRNDEVVSAENDLDSIPINRLSRRKLSTLEFSVDGWSVSLRKIPDEWRSDSNITHFCEITRESIITKRKEFREFIKDNLLPFLNLLFGQSIFIQQIKGKQKNSLIWIEIFGQPKIFPKTYGGNWFLRCEIHGSCFDSIELQFQHFYKLSAEIKKQWKKVIDHYVTSEEIIGTLRTTSAFSIAASVSFSALEGLTRSIISEYQDRDQWLRGNLEKDEKVSGKAKEDLRLKKGKGILDAIKMVAQREFGKHSEVFAMASRQIRDVRNATMHLDLTSDENPRNAYFRWNASQALIEILLLKKMGMTEIPNRTALGTFRIMGEDMFANQRKEELRFDQDHSEGGSPPYP